MELEKDILQKLNESLSETQIGSIRPDKNRLDELLRVKAEQLANLSDSMLSQYIYILSQYQVFLNVQYNSKKILALESKRIFEGALAKQVSKVEGKTVKERSYLVLENNIELQKLEKEMRILEADSNLFENIPSSVSELANALKKELSLRFNYKNPRNV